MAANNRILIIDDNPAIHEDIRKILVDAKGNDQTTDELLNIVLGKTLPRRSTTDFEIDSAYQGQEGLAMVETSLKEGRPYALAFVDVRMPPGWNGVETIAHLWSKDPSLQVVICTAYSDFSWHEIMEKLGNSDRLVILKKPFDNIEVLQLAHAMAKKWLVTRQVSAKFDDLDRLVNDRTRELSQLNRELANEVTAKETARAALRVSEDRLARAFDACPLPTVIFEVTEQRIMRVNPAMEKVMGRTQEQILGKRFWDVGFSQSDDLRKLAALSLPQKVSLRRQDCTFVSGDGDVRRGLLWLEPFELAAGQHVLALLQDVTEQNLLENQLRQAQKMEAVGHLAAGVAHDFNNLLTVIHGHTSMSLWDEDLDSNVAKSFQAVQAAAERAADLTRQLLAFSSKQVMEKTNLCLIGLITNVSSMLMRLIPANIQLHFKHCSANPYIHADRCNIEQVLLNLVVNARDAMFTSGGHIYVSTGELEVDAAHARRVSGAREGSHVCLCVQDTGCGMSEQTLQQIFEPFFTTKATGKGTGMGLSIVHGIIKQHDGWIEVWSEVNRGTSFCVYLPLSQVKKEKPVLVKKKVARTESRTVLLAEDDSSVRALAKTILEASNLRVMEAMDGPSAIELWKQHAGEIDMLLTDMVMPGGLSGLDVADHIRSSRPNIPVVFSSGYSVSLFNEDRQFRKDVNYLPKPYMAEDLISIVNRALVGDPKEMALTV